jgi:hypothetical protein
MVLLGAGLVVVGHDLVVTAADVVGDLVERYARTVTGRQSPP